MLGAIIGEICGSTGEARHNKDLRSGFCPPGSEITRPALETILLAAACVNGDLEAEIEHLSSEGILKLTPLAWAFPTLEITIAKTELVLRLLKADAQTRKEGIAFVTSLFLARTGRDKPSINAYLRDWLGVPMPVSATEVYTLVNSAVSGYTPFMRAFAFFFQGNELGEILLRSLWYEDSGESVPGLATALAEAWYGGVPEYYSRTAWTLMPSVCCEGVAQFHSIFKVPGPIHGMDSARRYLGATISCVNLDEHSDYEPPSYPRRTEAAYIGSLLAGGVGDALGQHVEEQARRTFQEEPSLIKLDEFPPVRGFTPHASDDTQMTLFCAEGLLQAWYRGTHRGICNPPVRRWAMRTTG
ncbi:MAG TPA: ADP-ribosylglycohydrolase family protein [Candidatus Ozemobacteraceae bacterium]|nr:ADP-ribosylglycohydrolase family protein [Candidatus Ozemobacteraceae bacterium]